MVAWQLRLAKQLIGKLDSCERSASSIFYFGVARSEAFRRAWRGKIRKLKLDKSSRALKEDKPERKLEALADGGKNLESQAGSLRHEGKNEL